MAAEIGSLGVLLEANTAGFEASMAKAAAAAEREMARTERANKKAAAEADRFIAVIQRQVDTFGLSGTALLRYEAGLKGASDRAGPLIDKLEQMRAAQAAGAAASDASASAGARFLASLNEQVSTFGKSSSELLAMKAAQLGVADSAGGLIAKLEQLQAAEREAAQAAAAAARSSAEQIASQRAAAAAQQAFIDGLQREAETIGKTRTELLTLKAAQLGLSDTAAPLIAQMERLQAAEKAKAAAQQASARAAQEAAAAERNAAQSRQTFLDSLQREADAIGKTRAELLTLKAAELGVGDAAAANIAKINAAAGGLSRYGVSAGQTAAAFRTLPAQMTDIATQLAGGQSPFLILLQQGGQIKDSFGGLGAALEALTSFITPARVAIAGLVAAAGGLAYVFGSAAGEATKLQQSLVLTGNFAGTTAGQFDAMATSIAASASVTSGAARDALQGLVSTGDVGPRLLKPMAEAVALTVKVTGEAADKAIADFAKMEGGVAKWAAEHNRSLNFINAATYANIQALEDQGRTEEAQAVVIAAYTARMEAAAQKTGFWSERVNFLKRDIDNLGEAIRKAFSGDLDAMLARADAALAARQKLLSVPFPNIQGKAADTADLERQRTALASATESEQVAAAMNAAAAATNKAGIAARDAHAKWLSQAKGIGAVNDELEKYRKQVADAARAGAPIPADEQAKVESQIRKSFAGPKGPKGREDDPAKTLRDNDLRDQERYIAAERDLAQQRNRFLDLYNGQGLISIQAYYDAKRAILDASTTASVAAYNKEIAAREAYQARQKRATDKAETQGKINEAVEKRDKLLRDAGATGIEFAVQQQAAEEALARSIANVNAELLQLQGRLGAAAGIRFDATNQSLVKSLTANGSDAALRQVETLRAYTVAQAEYTQQSTEAARVTDALANAEARIAISEKLGATTTLSALQQVGAARQAAVVQMEAIVAAEEAIARASGNPALIQQAEKARVSLEQLRASADVVGERFKTIFNSAGEEAFSGFITGSKTASQAFASFADSVLRDLSRIASQQISTGLFGAGGLGGLLASLLGPKYGGSVPGGTGVAGSVGNNPSAYTLPSANGNAFGPSGRITAFGRGDVFHKPTMFAYGAGNLGIMGEAGPEAVMPLKRGPNGKLGVVAQGAGGGDVYVNVHNNAGAQVETQESRRPDGGRQIDILINTAVRAVARNIRSGGDVATAIQGTYGVNRAAGVMRNG